MFILVTLIGREIDEGKIIYETKNTFYVLKDGKIKIIPKKDIFLKKEKLYIGVRYINDRIWERVKKKLKPKWRL